MPVIERLFPLVACSKGSCVVWAPGLQALDCLGSASAEGAGFEGYDGLKPN